MASYKIDITQPSPPRYLGKKLPMTSDFSSDVKIHEVVLYALMYYSPNIKYRNSYHTTLFSLD